MPDQYSGVDRRTFIQSSLLASLAAGLPSHAPVLVSQNDEEDKSKLIRNYNPAMKYKQAGNTDMYFSVLSLGGYLQQESVLRYALDKGVNMIHACATYSNGQFVKNLGNVLKDHRDKLYITLKDEFDNLDDVLRLLKTGYIDFLMFNRHNRSAASEPKILDKIEMYKRHGKIRYGGLTCHGDVKKATEAGIRSGMFPVIMPALNKPNMDSMEDEIKLAHEKGIGIIAMKGIMGITEPDLKTAQIKKMLQLPGITTFMKGIRTFDELDYFHKAAVEPLTSMENEALRKFGQASPHKICQMCDECKRTCPNHFEISTMLRCKNYYYNELGDAERAIDSYQKNRPPSIATGIL